MKGKLILTDIQSPVEGMQVVFTMSKHIWVIAEDNRTGGYKEFEIQLHYAKLRLHELKQIVVEYGLDCGSSVYKQQLLPLHPDDWKWGIEHIGEEVEFEALKASYEDKEKSIAVLESNVCYQRLKSFKEKYDPKLIHPVTYTEEEVKSLIRKWDMHVNGEGDHTYMETLDNEIDTFWNEHKKK